MDTRKCIPLVGAKSALTCAGSQTAPSHVRWCSAEKGNLGKFGPTFCLHAVFAPKECSYQKEPRAMESRKMYSSRRCKKRTFLCGSANYPVSCNRVYCREGNLGKFGPTFRHDAVFAPKQCLYQKEARPMDISKMYSSCRCNKRTYLCGSANYPVSCKVV